MEGGSTKARNKHKKIIKEGKSEPTAEKGQRGKFK